MTFPTKLKPETIARRAREIAEARAASRALLIDRLTAKVAAEGPASIWAEMLAETLERDAMERGA